MMRRMLGRGFFYIQEIAPVSQRLDNQKDRVKQQRHRCEKNFLFGGKGWTAGRSSEIWQHQTEHSQGHDHVEVGIDALDVVMLFAISQAAKHYRRTHQAVEREQHYNIQGVNAYLNVIMAL